MKHNRILFIVLALVLALSLCACSRPRLVTSEKLEVEIKGEGTKTLTVNVMGPSNTQYTNEISGPEDEGAVYALKSSESGEDNIKIKLSGIKTGSSSLIVKYLDGEASYALVNITVSVGEDMKFGEASVVFAGDDPYEAVEGDVPEGSYASKGSSSSKMVALTSEEGPWFVIGCDDSILSVEEYGLSEESGCYEFLVAAVASGNGSVKVANSRMNQSITLDFEVTSVINGNDQSLELALVNSTKGAYDEKESEAYIEAAGSTMEEINLFSPDVFVPASFELQGCGEEEGRLEVSLKDGDTSLEYMVFKDITLKEELAAYKKEFPGAETDSFETNGIEVTIFQIEDYAVAIWERYDLLCELFMIDESGIDIYRAGDIIEAFLSDTAL